jgi:alpha-tubulin suppressor-like RCC1 family protein
VLGLDTDVAAISVQDQHACALQRGVAYCWGKNASGELGNGTTTNSRVPVRVQGLGSVSQITAGEGATCAIVDGAAFCWGTNASGQLTLPIGGFRTEPLPIVGLSSGVTSIAIGQAEVCAVQNGHAVCWGNVSSGVFGTGVLIGAADRSLAPFGPAGAPIVELSTCGMNGCLLQSGRALAWGFNNYGQLGNGSVVASAEPVPVAFPQP